LPGNKKKKFVNHQPFIYNRWAFRVFSQQYTLVYYAYKPLEMRFIAFMKCIRRSFVEAERKIYCILVIKKYFKLPFLNKFHNDWKNESTDSDSHTKSTHKNYEILGTIKLRKSFLFLLENAVWKTVRVQSGKSVVYFDYQKTGSKYNCIAPFPPWTRKTALSCLKGTAKTFWGETPTELYGVPPVKKSRQIIPSAGKLETKKERTR